MFVNVFTLSIIKLFVVTIAHVSCVFHSSSRAAAVVQSLLSNYIQQLKCPAHMHTNQSHHGVLHGVTSAIACMYHSGIN